MSIYLAVALVTTASGAPMEVEAGLIENQTAMVVTPAVRAGLRVKRESLGFTGALLFRPDRGAEGLSDLTHSLIIISNEGSSQVDFQQPVEFESLAVQALVDWDFGVMERPQGLSGGMRIYGGLQAGLLTQYYAKYDANESPPTVLVNAGSRQALGPVIGVGYEVWSRGVAGLGFGSLYRAYYGLLPQYDPDEVVDDRGMLGEWTTYAKLVFAVGGGK